MKILELTATKETIDIKAGGAIIYETNVTTEGPGVILTDNPKGEYSVALLSTYHPGGPVQVIMKGVGPTGNKKYEVGQVVAKIAVFQYVGKTRNRSKSEVEFLRGENRRLKAELKYYKRRAHIENSIIDDVIEEAPLENVRPLDQCPNCGKGLMIEYDFKFATLKKCDSCGHEERKRK